MPEGIPNKRNQRARYLRLERRDGKNPAGTCSFRAGNAPAGRKAVGTYGSCSLLCLYRTRDRLCENDGASGQGKRELGGFDQISYAGQWKKVVENGERDFARIVAEKAENAF